MSTRFTAQGLVHEHSEACSHSVDGAWIEPVSHYVPVSQPTTRHLWARIDYEDDVVPWHCMRCDTFDTSLWDEPCPNQEQLQPPTDQPTLESQTPEETPAFRRTPPRGQR